MFFQLIIYFALLPENTSRRQSLLCGGSRAPASITRSSHISSLRPTASEALGRISRFGPEPPGESRNSVMDLTDRPPAGPPWPRRLPLLPRSRWQRVGSLVVLIRCRLAPRRNFPPAAARRRTCELVCTHENV